MTIEVISGASDYSSVAHNRSLPEAQLFAHSLFKPYSRYLNIALSAPHWQLKDLLLSSSYTNYNSQLTSSPKFYFPYKNRVFCFDYSSLLESDCNVTTDIIRYSSIGFQSNPRCLKQLDGTVVTGGINNGAELIGPNPVGLHKGSFSVYNSETNLTEDVQVGDFINNCVSINRSSTSNSYFSYLCNNDKHLYGFEITNSRIVQSSNPTYLKVALNHSILSDDNNTLITVGDSSKIFISHPQESNPKALNSNDFDILQTNGDCGFSTSFLSNNYQFITCFQDGLALIYDLRNLNRPLHSITSTRPKSQPGAFRVVKTSKNGDDLICISEHQSRIHLIDGRNFDNHSVLLLPKYLMNVPPAISVSYKKSINNNIILKDTKSYDGGGGGGGSDHADHDDEEEEEDGIADYSGDAATDTDVAPDNDDDGYSKMFGKYPISVSGDPKRNLMETWYNQPIVRDIDDFADLNYFGGDLNLGYLESYRYLDIRYGNNYNSRYTNHTGNADESSNELKVILQGSFDRENILERKVKTDFNPQMSNLLTNKCGRSAPLQIRKHQGDGIGNATEDNAKIFYKENEIRDASVGTWWNSEEEVDYKDRWPWTKVPHGPSDSRDVGPGYGDDLNIMETPRRDPFFYVDSDVEINGLELANNRGKSVLCIGTKEGMVFWDIDDWRRKCFPSFGYV